MSGSPLDTGTVFELVKRRPQASVVQRRVVTGTGCVNILRLIIYLSVRKVTSVNDKINILSAIVSCYGVRHVQ